MSLVSKISWTDASWNPVTGCSKVSPGCLNCYAESLSLRQGWSKEKWSPANAKQNVILHPDRLKMVKKLKPGSRCFVNSMSDLFHELVPREFITDVFIAMRSRPDVTFQVLTKRPQIIGDMISRADRFPNIWLGTSVEDQLRSSRIQDLLVVKECDPNAILFVSVEPLIGPVKADFRGIDWVIVGGESGPGFRPMDHAWARQVRDDALAAGAAFFFKQSAAYRNETGSALDHGDGTFWEWQQFPDDRREPQQVQR